MKTKTIYLAGPMAFLSGNEMKAWRDLAFEQLHEGTVVLDPTRRVPYHTQVYNDRNNNINLCKRLFKQDLLDIDSSDILLVDARNYDHAKAQGTSAEIMYAWTKGKVIIMFKNEWDLINPFFTAMATEIHNSLEDAVDACNEY
jgi:nucleoside 2-deoxyribosyltransferase